MRNCIILPVKCLLKILSLFSTSPVVFFQLSSLLYSAFHCIAFETVLIFGWTLTAQANEHHAVEWEKKENWHFPKKSETKRLFAYLPNTFVWCVSVCVWRKKRYMERNIFLIVYLRRCFNEFSNKAATKQKPILFVQIRE